MTPPATTGLILGIESSCDETSAAVVRAGTEVLSNVVASQVVHADYGGVVPELASREHLRAIVPVVRQAMQQAGVTYADLAAIAVTEGPGLAGALLVGITFAKSLAFGADKPLIAVNHLEGHIHAVLMADPQLANADPLLALVVSGGHTHLYLSQAAANGGRTYRNVGKTLDDAAGEAFDKVAKLLGLPYPGGPWIDALARHGDPHAVPFALPQIKQKASGNTAPKLLREFAAQQQQIAWKGTGFSPYASSPGEGGTSAPEGPAARRFDMSFSGIKTAVRRYVELHNMQPGAQLREAALREAGLHKARPDAANIARAREHLDQQTLDLIASFQQIVVTYLARRALAAAEHFAARGLIVTGGVSANSLLRERMTNVATHLNLPVAFPTLALATDNAAMIAAAAWPKWLAGNFADDTLEPTPQMRLG